MKSENKEYTDQELFEIWDNISAKEKLKHIKNLYENHPEELCETFEDCFGMDMDDFDPPSE